MHPGEVGIQISVLAERPSIGATHGRSLANRYVCIPLLFHWGLVTKAIRMSGPDEGFEDRVRRQGL